MNVNVKIPQKVDFARQLCLESANDLMKLEFYSKTKVTVIQVRMVVLEPAQAQRKCQNKWEIFEKKLFYQSETYFERATIIETFGISILTSARSRNNIYSIMRAFLVTQVDM